MWARIRRFGMPRFPGAALLGASGRPARSVVRFFAADELDRTLIAHARTENLLLVSNEAIFDRTGVRGYW